MNLAPTLALVLFSLVIRLDADVAKERLALANDVVAATQIRERLPQMVNAIVAMEKQQAQLRGDPPDTIQKIEVRLREYFEYDFEVEGLEAVMAKAYSEDFTVEELKEILNYLRSPAIKKFMDTQGPRMVKMQEFLLSDLAKTLGQHGETSSEQPAPSDDDKPAK